MANVAGMTYLPHDKTWWGDRLIVPNRVNALWWHALPPRSVWSAPMFDVDMISVGQRDNDLEESLRNLIPGFADGSNDFIKMGYVDIQGWLINYDQPLTETLTATPDQIIDDYIRKVPVPQVNPGQSISADQVLQTVAETVGPDSNISAPGQDQVVDTDNERTVNDQEFKGLATKHPAVIDQAAWYELGPHMFYEERIYLGVRHGNAIPIGEQKQRYNAAIRTNIGGKGSMGKFAVVIFTASMPNLEAFGNAYDERDEPLSPWESWEDMIMTYQRAPLEYFEMQDEVSLANARYRFRQDVQRVQAGNPNEPSTHPQTGLWGVTGNFDKYLVDKRGYSVKQGVWEQKPLLASIRVNHTINAPFMLVPSRM